MYYSYVYTIGTEKRVKTYDQNDKKLPYFESEYKSRWEKGTERAEEHFIEKNKRRSNASIILCSLPVKNSGCRRPVVEFEINSERNGAKKNIR